MSLWKVFKFSERLSIHDWYQVWLNQFGRASNGSMDRMLGRQQNPRVVVSHQIQGMVGAVLFT